ncbi:hypothetical protein COY14_00545 [Candidatus Roizmanbacteria bacterium CG_4_10_14_0_2_um_filter_36_9]|uniref:DNA replication and repair protein RecF n=1 Tax=Candidatus Roizmanbacteria bacterium CG_4_10_14_0_2_um_filter_36_9 TaxID=1974823 RepID=A0A2M7U5Q9_9BACT|nr:MAG: hypothetical protein COY14_00545 [Candidatus Roizmanbacteria bacterium CG_4_10_14_0_2_um_filter_36_9]
MLISAISLTNFRNFKSAKYEFSPNLTLIIGKNALGKTTLLEAIYVAIYGTGFRESREVELVNFDHDDCIIDAEFFKDSTLERFQIRILRSVDDRVAKTFYLDKAVKSATKYRKNQTQAVLFAPEQIRIITGSPSRKRKYVDSVISAIDPEYKKSLRLYESAFRRRNKVLERYESEDDLEHELIYWDKLIVDNGVELTTKRKSLIEFINNNPTINGKAFSIEYIPNIITAEKLVTVRDREMRLRRTLIGPQKDDFEISLTTNSKKNVSLYGSRSEQRMAVFWLKLNELKLFEEKSKKKPILLLDDIFSELDENNRKLVMKMIGNYQTIATTTEVEIGEIRQDLSKIVIEL